MEKPAITKVPIDDTLAQRWSGRSYDASKTVSRDQLIALLEAARWAPSCFGDQPWRFVVWDKLQDEALWQKALDCLVPGNQAWAKDAQLLFLVTAGSLFSHNGKENRWGQYDTGAATENLCLQASAAGLMAHQMGGFDVDKARSTFGIPPEYALMAMVSVGYPADVSTLTGEVLERETAARKRLELNELFFSGSWAEPLI